MSALPRPVRPPRATRSQSRLRTGDALAPRLGTDFDPDAFLRSIAGYGGMAAGCEFAVLFQTFNVS